MHKVFAKGLKMNIIINRTETGLQCSVDTDRTSNMNTETPLCRVDTFEGSNVLKQSSQTHNQATTPNPRRKFSHKACTFPFTHKIHVKNKSQTSPSCSTIFAHQLVSLRCYLSTLTLVLLLLADLPLLMNAQTLSYSIYEEKEAGDFVGNVKHDSESLDVAHMDEYIFTFRYDTEHYLLFGIDQNTGVIRSKVSIDRESVCEAHVEPCIKELDITVRPVEYFRILKVTVEIIDVNDHVPEFPQLRVLRSISEDILPGITVPLPHANDLDSGTNTITDYSLVPLLGEGEVDRSQDDADRKFGLKVTPNADGSQDIAVVVLSRLDREEQSSYLYRVTAYDGGDPRLSGTMVLEVTITDSNDNSPAFDSPTYEADVFENSPIGTPIVQVHATDADADQNGRVQYSFSSHTQSLHGHLFSINATSGQINIAGELNYESSPMYHLTVTASDMGPNSRPAYCKVVVTVIDVNDHEPKISLNTLTSSGYAEVRENGELGAFVGHLSVTDPDEGDSGQIRCELDHDSRAYFDLQQISDTFEFKVVTKVVFDREEKHSYNVVVTCTDSGSPDPLSSNKVMPVHILDTNDHAPEFASEQYFANLHENNTLNSYITKMVANDLDIGDNAELTYSIQPIGADVNPDDRQPMNVKIDPVSGIVKTNAIFDFEERRVYQYKVIARDHGNPPKMAETSLNISIIDVNDESPVFNQTEYRFSVWENRPSGTLVGRVFSTDRDSYPFNEISYFIDASSQGLEHEYFDVTSGGEIITTVALDREETVRYRLVLVAHNQGYANTIATVNVYVDVKDENDNRPIILFPSPTNQSVSVPVDTPVNHIVATIRASDADSGENSRLWYAITGSDGTRDPRFTVNNQTGDIILVESLSEIDYEETVLTVIVQDQSPIILDSAQGSVQRRSLLQQPTVKHSHLSSIFRRSTDLVETSGPLRSQASLVVLISATVAYSGQSDPLTDIDSLMLPLGIVVGVIILLILITMVIIVTRYRYGITAGARNRRAGLNASSKDRKYNCRLEANNKLMGNGGSHIPMTVQKLYGGGGYIANGYMNGVRGGGEEGGVVVVQDTLTSKQDVNKPQDITDAREDTFKKQSIGSDLMADFHRHSCPLKAHALGTSNTSGLYQESNTTARQAKMPDIVALSHLEVDSECSGGGDSGKGTSEEGDYSSAAAVQRPLHHKESLSPPRSNYSATPTPHLPPPAPSPSDSDLELYSDPGINPLNGQVNGSLPSRYYRNQYSPLVTFSQFNNNNDHCNPSLKQQESTRNPASQLRNSSLNGQSQRSYPTSPVEPQIVYNGCKNSANSSSAGYSPLLSGSIDNVRATLPAGYRKSHRHGYRKNVRAYNNSGVDPNMPPPPPPSTQHEESLIEYPPEPPIETNIDSPTLEDKLTQQPMVVRVVARDSVNNNEKSASNELPEDSASSLTLQQCSDIINRSSRNSPSLSSSCNSSAAGIIKPLPSNSDVKSHHTDPVWSGREGSFRTEKQDGRRQHLFGIQENNNSISGDKSEGHSYTLPSKQHQKSAFKAIGAAVNGNQHTHGTSHTLNRTKKEVRFADKCTERPFCVSDEVAGECGSTDGLSEDGTSITSGSYVLDSGRVINGCQDTFV